MKCNRVVQKDKVIKPGERVLVLLKGPGATFEVFAHGQPFTEAALRRTGQKGESQLLD